MNLSVPLRSLRRYATLSRSLGLLADFKYEQTDPARFYGHLADDTVELLTRIWQDCQGSAGDSHSALAGRTVLDVGGGPGYFARAFADAGVDYVSVEPDVGEMSAAGIELESSVRGSGLDLPFRTGSFDLVYSSNVAEHVPLPWRMAEEMLRVTKPGGLAIISYTCWYGPFGGHEMCWTHYLGGHRAARMYTKKHGHRPKNLYGESLFKVGTAEGLRWAKNTSAGTLVADFPRYHPWWAWWINRVPVLRELGTSNLVLVMRR